jgi:hypothetical protein
MTREELKDVFVKLGWTKFRFDTEILIAKRLDNCIISSMPRIFCLNEIEANCKLSIDVYDHACSYIANHNRRILQINIICLKKFRQISTFSFAEIEDISNNMEAWAQAQDVEKHLAVLRELPTTSLGAMPKRHLAALAVNGDIEILTHYQESFAKGDRLGFVPYIDEGYIGRALEFAKRRRTDPNWMPDKPKTRL